MFLAIDIGNKFINIGILDKEWRNYSIATEPVCTSDECGIKLTGVLGMAGVTFGEIDDVIISSVVPGLLDMFMEAVHKMMGKKALALLPGCKTGVKIICDNPKEVGGDRIANMAAAYNLYGGDVIVVDFGSATCFDYVDKEGNYSTGVTAPGLGISALAMHDMTAKLPMVDLHKPASILSHNTYDSVQAGIMYGFIGQCLYILEQMISELKHRPQKIIATGNMGRKIYKDINLIDSYYQDMTMAGLKIIFDKNKGKKA